MHRQELRRLGLTGRQITLAVRSGSLLRPRNDHYLPADTHPDLVNAVHSGGRLDCLSLMSHLTVFVLDDRRLHIQLDRDASRVPAPPTRMVRHWRPTTVAEDATTTSVIEALAQAVRCQSPRAAIATLDSAWHLGVVDERGVADVFARLPSRYRPLRALLDPRAESGIETLVRLMLRQLGYDAELQVPLQDVGFVDLLVDGWLIVECDSAAHHRS